MSSGSNTHPHSKITASFFRFVWIYKHSNPLAGDFLWPKSILPYWQCSCHVLFLGIRFKDYLISWFSQLFGTRNIKRWQGTFSSDFWLLWWLGHVCDVYELVDLFCSCGVVVLQPLVSHWATLISPNYFLLHSVLVPGILILVVVSSTFRRIWHCRRVLRTPLCQFLWQSDTGFEKETSKN